MAKKKTTGEITPSEAAKALGRLGGLKGGKARAERLTPAQLSRIGKKGGKVGGKARAAALTAEQRSAIARKAGLARAAKRPKKEADSGE